MRQLGAMLAVGAVLVTGSAAAQDTTTEALPTDAPRWSLGAGVGFGQLVFLSDPDDVLTLMQGTGLTPQASIEYRLHDGLALVLGATTRVISVSPDGGDSDTDVAVGARLGLRRFMGATGPTRLSFHGVLALGHLSRAGRGPFDDALDYTQGALVGGLGVDHAFTPGLSLRLATDVLGLTYTNVSSDGGVSTDILGIDLGLAPSLELRLAF